MDERTRSALPVRSRRGRPVSVSARPLAEPMKALDFT
jgi:hypothetical protein